MLPHRDVQAVTARIDPAGVSSVPPCLTLLTRRNTCVSRGDTACSSPYISVAKHSKACSGPQRARSDCESPPSSLSATGCRQTCSPKPPHLPRSFPSTPETTPRTSLQASSPSPPGGLVRNAARGRRTTRTTRRMTRRGKGHRRRYVRGHTVRHRDAERLSTLENCPGKPSR